MPSNPGWAEGYVPTQEEWMAAFSGKVDYPAPVDQGGSGADNSQGASYNLLCRSLIGTTPFSAQPLNWYGLRTSVSAITVQLPALSALQPGDWIEFVDVDFNANNHNVTIQALGSDTIALYSTFGGSQTLDVAGVRVQLIVNTTRWRMIVG